MNPMLFTVEEENLICVFDVSSRAALMADIRYAMPYFDEPELLETADHVLSILDSMTDAEFSELTFNPAYDNDDDELEEV